MFKLQPFLFSTLSVPAARAICEESGLCSLQSFPAPRRQPKAAGLFGASPRLPSEIHERVSAAA